MSGNENTEHEQCGILGILREMLVEQKRTVSLLKKIAIPAAEQTKRDDDARDADFRASVRYFITDLEAKHGLCPSAMKKAIRESVHGHGLFSYFHCGDDDYGWAFFRPANPSVDFSRIGRWKPGSKRQKLWDEWTAKPRPKKTPIPS